MSTQLAPFQRTFDRTRRDTRMRLVALMTVVATILIIGSLSVTSVAKAEVGATSEATWGVYGVDPDAYFSNIAIEVFAIEQIGPRVYVGGRFAEVRPWKHAAGISQPYLAAFDARTGIFLDDWRPQVNGPVYALEAAADGSRLFVGGEFWDVDGVPGTQALAALDPETGSVDPVWRAEVDRRFTTEIPAVVRSLDSTSDHLYVGGGFNSIGGRSGVAQTTVYRVAKLSAASGEPDRAFAPRVTGGDIWGINVSPDGSRVYLGGRHTAVNEAPGTKAFAAVRSTDGGLVAGMATYVGNFQTLKYVQDVESVGELVFVGGSQHILSVLSAADLSVVRVHTTFWAEAGREAGRGGDYQDIEVVGDRVYASCHCWGRHFADWDYSTTWPNIPNRVVRTESNLVHAYSAVDGSHIPAFLPDINARVDGPWALHGDDQGCLWVGGDISRTTKADGTNRAHGGFAKLCDDQIERPATTPVASKMLPLIPTAPKTTAPKTTAQKTTAPKTTAPKTTAPKTTAPKTALAAVVPTTVIAPDTVAPSTPSVVVDEVRHDLVVLRWTRSTDDGEIDHYEITRDGAVVLTKSSRNAVVWFSDKDVKAASTHTYHVVAVDAAGNRSLPAETSVTSPARLRPLNATTTIDARSGFVVEAPTPEAPTSGAPPQPSES